MDLTEKTLTSELIYDGKVVHLYKDTVSLPDGGSSTREIVRHVGAVCILPLTAQNEVVLERQYRYAIGQTLIEIPAGKLDTPDEDVREAALRELREETGLVPAELVDLGDFYGSPAVMGERIRMFLARGLTQSAQCLDEDEFLEIFTIPIEEAVTKILAGELPDGKTQAAVLKVYTLLQKEGKLK